MIRALVLCLLAGPVAADPLFQDRSGALPMHIYDGGWEHFVGGGVAVFDCNNNGLPDIFAAGGETQAILLRNGGDFRFTPLPLPALTGVTGAYPIDIDADGAMDLFVMRVGPNIVLRGDGACGFTDATADWAVPMGDHWTTAFSAWWDGDGRPVMAVGNYVDRKNPDGPFEACDANQILTPVTGGYASVDLTPGFCPLSILAAQDARGRLTLRLSNDRHYYVRGGHEQMWDIAEGRFLGPDDGWQNVSLWGMGIASRDLTGNGRDDVMLTSMGDQLLQLAQEDGTYANAPYSIGTYAQRPHTGDDGRPSTGWHAEFADVDNDTRADLFIAKGNVDQMPGLAMADPNNLLMQQADGRFVEAGQTAGIATTARSRGAALADFDGDGRLDLIVVNRRAPLKIYRNVTKDTGNWLQIALRQSGGNRNAIGAIVTVTTDSGTQSQQNIIGGGHAGGKALPLHFGLGKADRAIVTVTWPDGAQSRHQVQANAPLTLGHPRDG
ncbi:CRTAC1 family protein [Yoonia vestfoldensis]|uniref:Repeat domain in Vibrio, Colwellia, Bradyrhizobium and Shewanella n=1 Tax=Yoonia vestfoldensis TaxID=245188 RepID=A0A1Y0ECI6_9RHOB|nr:CRTAC1 family protein [Yoonia vestfoldensis]ARU01315.1 repeat domain in Vibrio, Colwellia, Bradyrhizobium and Shewanella [Yoonia vestfoldensis]